MDSSGNVLLDSLGNKKIKYDSFGYPELFPEGDLSFSVSLPPANPDRSESIVGYNGTLTSSSKSEYFDTNPDPTTNQNRFCLSAIYIQTSDIFCLSREGNVASLLNGVFLDVYVNDKIYQSIPFQEKDRYSISNRTGVTDGSGSGQYQIYQFNKIHYFRYPVKGRVKFVLRGSEPNGGMNLGVREIGRAHV